MLSHFPSLEVLRGPIVWEAVNQDNDKMHFAIMRLAQILPNLRELDHSTFDKRRKAVNRIVLQWEFITQRVPKQPVKPEMGGVAQAQASVNDPEQGTSAEKDEQLVKFPFGGNQK